MGTKVVKKAKEKTWVLPDLKLTHKEFIEGIKKAEDGPFYSPEEFEKRFEQWKKEKGYC